MHLSWEQARDSESLLELVAAKVVLPKTLRERRGEIHPGMPAESKIVITIINNNIMMKRLKNELPSPKIKFEDNSNAVKKRGKSRERPPKPACQLQYKEPRPAGQSSKSSYCPTAFPKHHSKLSENEPKMQGEIYHTIKRQSRCLHPFREKRYEEGEGRA